MSEWYNGGTLAAEEESVSIVGTDTLFMTRVKDGDMLVTFQGGTLRLNQVLSRENDNHLTISPPWSGDTGSGLVYQIVPTSTDWGQISKVATDLATFLSTRASFFPTEGKPAADLGGNGSFAIDSNATPPLLYSKNAGVWDDGKSLGGPMGATGKGYGGTSADSKTLVSSGSMSFTTQSNLAWLSGSPIRMASATAPTTKWMEGIVTSYSLVGDAWTLVVTIQRKGTGTGSASDWTFSPSGMPGEKGDTPKILGTSTDSKAIGTSAVTVATQSDLAIAIGSWITLASAASPANFMFGPVTAYSAGSLTINPLLTGGSGTYSDWVITSSGPRGASGSTGLGYGGTSTTSRAIGASGSMTWNIGSGYAYQSGDLVKCVVSTDSTQWMKGKVSGYSAGVLTLDIIEKSPTGVGTYNSWNIGLAGDSGPANVLSIGTVETVDPGDDAAATITGSSPSQSLNLKIPKGTPGTAGSILVATSTSSLTPAPGDQTFTLSANANFLVNQRVRAASNSNADNFMSGKVKSWNAGTKALVVTVDLLGPGPATATDWNIAVTGEKGDQGPAGGFGTLLATKGNEPVADGSTYGAFAVGANGSMQVADSSQTYGKVWRFIDSVLSDSFWSQSDVASAATCDIGASTTPFVRITGTTTITSLGTGANKRREVEFTGSLILTYNGTSLILPGLANIITQAGDKGIFVSDASGNWKCVAWTPLRFLPKEVLTGNRTYYVRTDGNDANNGRTNSSGGAFLTIQKAVDAATALDFSIYSVTIQIADGTYTAGATLTTPPSGPLIINGNATTPTNVVVQASTVILVLCAGAVTVQNFVAEGSSYCLRAAKVGASITIGAGMRLTGAGTSISAEQLSSISSDSKTLTISGNKPAWMLASGNSNISLTSMTINFSGTPAFSSYGIGFNSGGSITLTGTLSGSATGIRYYGTTNGVLNTGGAGTASTYFPGNANGQLNSGAQQI